MKKKNNIVVMVVCIVASICMSVAIITQKKKSQADKELSILVSNCDYSIENMNQIAIDNGFDGYEDMIEYFVSIGELYYVPAFTYEGTDYTYDYSERYTRKDTIIYNDAFEMGVVKE